jgi:hypothetical protein
VNTRVDQENQHNNSKKPKDRISKKRHEEKKMDVESIKK